MAFNFKNNNLTIILLLILVIGSSMCYLMIEKNMEGFISGFDSSITNKFRDLGSLSGKTDRSFLILNDNKRYRFNTGPTNVGIGYSNKIRDSSGEFKFVGKTTIPDLSYNAYLYKGSGDDPASTTITISYELYNINLAGTYDICSIPLGNTNQDFSGTTNILMVYDQSGYFYDISGRNRRPQFNLRLDGEYLISNGRLMGEIPRANGLLSNTGGVNNTTTGWQGNIDLGGMFQGLNSGQFPPNMTPEMYAYMLQGSMGLGNQGYTMPFYNSFESAMNNPSNPLVNPTNAMNPLQYNQSLFGPNVSPMMAQNMCKNSSADKSEKVREDDKSKDSTINSSLGSNNVLNSTFDKLNSSANTMLAQNTGDEGKGGSSGNGNGNGNNSQNSSGNPPPCPPCARCPESNYECKKVPAYEQGYENTALPRPVLSDFSTFGM